MADIANGSQRNWIYRHPHIYGDVEVENEEDVKELEASNSKEGKGKKTVLEGVPKGLPALVKAQRIQDKVAE